MSTDARLDRQSLVAREVPGGGSTCSASEAERPSMSRPVLVHPRGPPSVHVKYRAITDEGEQSDGDSLIRLVGRGIGGPRPADSGPKWAPSGREWSRGCRGRAQG